MEEILKELIKSTTENGPQKHFYSNLTITEPFQKHVDISSRISKGICFLEKALDSKTGFQSRPYKSRKCKEPSCSSEYLHQYKEIYTSLLALELFEDGQNFEINFSESSLKSLRDFILPECAITTLNIFKTSSMESESSDEQKNDNGDGEKSQNIISDDCNTTSLVVSFLLKEGILEYQPAASITEFLLSNVSDISEHANKFPRVIRTFLDGNETNGVEELDAITCANVLYLYYQTEMNLNYEENVESTENFLLKTLKSLLAIEDQEFDQLKSSTTTKTATPIIPSALHHSTDALIFFLSRVTSISEHAKNRFSKLLIKLLDKRISKSSNTLDLSMRILAANLLTNDHSTTMRCKITKDYETLASLQNNIDGSWPADSLFKIRINGTEIFYGGREVSTIFACKALDVYYKSMKAVKIKTRLYKDFMY